MGHKDDEKIKEKVTKVLSKIASKIGENISDVSIQQIEFNYSDNLRSILSEQKKDSWKELQFYKNKCPNGWDKRYELGTPIWLCKECHEEAIRLEGNQIKSREGDNVNRTESYPMYLRTRR